MIPFIPKRWFEACRKEATQGEWFDFFDPSEQFILYGLLNIHPSRKKEEMYTLFLLGFVTASEWTNED